ncbi:Sec-independent protein translocase protein TatB [Collimonas sp.]|jgi:sec-independent protein translocase protein TatB|uniref:Sec-independent protein translocase protein TatB n=1 Tax=Collimonas sp. TaxID=1963772 RepID=UPI002B6D5035|nr:Sec-independent protein translocase protein TatB [Collimonas sp.]HWX01245.1 Sec-independent protein translocase protein TatB [Collimonas sp.]
MIDIGLTKLALIGVVALVVVGPEKLPTVARMAGSLFGRAQRYINEVKAEVSREIELDELRKMQQDVQEAAGDIEQSIARGMADADKYVHAAWDDSASSTPETYKVEQLAIKAKSFRKKKLARSSAVPAWYKQQSGQKSRVLSGAARVAKYRPASQGKSSASFFS